MKDGISVPSRTYNISTTLWTFLSQTLSEGHNCVKPVTWLIAFRSANGQSIPSSKTGAYCIACDKLDEPAMHAVVTQTGAHVAELAADGRLWLGHPVKIGTCPPFSD